MKKKTIFDNNSIEENKKKQKDTYTYIDIEKASICNNIGILIF